MPERLLIINADDFGLCEEVNRGVVEACQRGLLRATTLMANGAAFDDAVARAGTHPALDVGCHLVLVGGSSVALPGKKLPRTLVELLISLARDPSVARIEEEFAAQVERLIAAGVAPSHLDTHKHTHLLPPVLKAMLRTAQRYGVRWIRRPFDLPLTAARAQAPAGRHTVSRLLGRLDGPFRRRLARAGCRATDFFAGFQLTGTLRSRELADLIRNLPPGLTELMCHPGYCGPELRNLPTRLKESRERELEALLSPEARQAAEDSQVRSVSYRDLDERPAESPFEAASGRVIG